MPRSLGPLSLGSLFLGRSWKRPSLKGCYAVVLGILALAGVTTADEKPAAPTFRPDISEVYRTTPEGDLRMHVFLPETHSADDARPAIVFFFGGGWRSGSPQQFFPHCRYLASRGMVAMAAEYRVLSRHGTPAVKCVEDAKAAVRWARRQAGRWNIDPARVAAGGGSAGGHLAACTALIEGFDPTAEGTEIRSSPNALVLFNPAVILANSDKYRGFPEARGAELRKRLGVEAEQLSPYHHIRGALPPTIIFHGDADTTVPIATVQAFTTAMQEAGNRCQLVTAKGAGHGYFNYARGDGSAFRATTLAMDRFFVDLGWFHGPATLESFLRSDE